MMTGRVEDVLAMKDELASLRTQLSAAQQAREQLAKGVLDTAMTLTDCDEGGDHHEELLAKSPMELLAYLTDQGERGEFFVDSLCERLASAEKAERDLRERAERLEEGVRKTRNDVASLYNACLERRKYFVSNEQWLDSGEGTRASVCKGIVQKLDALLAPANEEAKDGN